MSAAAMREHAAPRNVPMLANDREAQGQSFVLAKGREAGLRGIG